MSGLYYNLALRNSDLRDKDSEKLYYCVLKNRGMVDQDTFVNYLSQISGVQEALCLAMISKLGAAVINYLQDGRSVDIPHLGTFNLTASSTGVKTLDEAKASQIKAINLRFSTKEETDLVLSRCALTRSVSLTNLNDVIKEKAPHMSTNIPRAEKPQSQLPASPAHCPSPVFPGFPNLRGDLSLCFL